MMSKPLKNPPVYFTLAQVRFNAILNLSEYLPSIQNALRQTGYSVFSKLNSVALQFNVQEGQQAIPQPFNYEQYFFTNLEQTHSFLLSTDALTFQSTDYGTYEAFSSSFLDGLTVVHDEVKLDFTERIGLRYLDHVAPTKDDNLEQYFATEVQGLGSRLGGQSMHSFVEMFNKINDINLVTRILTQEGRLTFPPDLQPQNMKVQPRFNKVTGKNSIIDTDGSIQMRELFSITSIQQHLAEIHEIISQAFRETVTPYALGTWDKE